MPSRISSSAASGRRPKRRMESVGASSVTGGSVALTRLPSGSRASTIGERLVDPPAHAGGDPLDDPHQVVDVAETHAGLFQASETLDIDLIGAIDEDVGHGRIGHQRRQRADAQRLLQQVVDEPPALVLVQRKILIPQGVVDKSLARSRSAIPRSPPAYCGGPTRPKAAGAEIPLTE